LYIEKNKIVGEEELMALEKIQKANDIKELTEEEL
jgi:hypothetical protein